MNTKLFRNATTTENIKRLACLAYNMDRRGSIKIGLSLLQAADIGKITDDEVLLNNKRSNYDLLRKYKEHLMSVGFITCVSKSYQVGVRSRTYRVEKEAIANTYGMDVVNSFKAVLDERIWKKDSPDSFSERLVEMNFEEPAALDVAWELIGPGHIKLKKPGHRPKEIKYKREFGNQRFSRESFFFCKEAMIAFVQSLRYRQIDDEVQQQVDVLNGGTPGEFKIDFRIRLSVKWTKDLRAFKTKKSTRAYSPFCSYKKADGSRQRLLDREGLSKQFDIKSAVPRVAYYLQKGSVWLDNSIDLYKMIFDESKIPGEFTPELRDHLKGAFMTMYFKDLVQQSWIAYSRHHSAKVKSSTRGKSNLEKNGPALFSLDEYKELFEATRRVLGPSIGSEIFLVESILEIDVVHHFKNLGHKIYNVYDCFFFDDGLTAEEVQAYLPTAARNALLRWFP